MSTKPRPTCRTCSYRIRCPSRPDRDGETACPDYDGEGEEFPRWRNRRRIRRKEPRP